MAKTELLKIFIVLRYYISTKYCHAIQFEGMCCNTD